LLPPTIGYQCWRNLIVAIVASVIIAQCGSVWANGVPIGAVPGGGTLTHFEAFVLAECSPCVRETYSLATFPVAPIKGPDFPRSVGAPGAMTRSGEVVFELLRAYPLGHVARQQFAMRVTLAVTTGAPGQTFLLGAGLVDESDVPKVASMLAEIVRVVDDARPDAQLTDIEAHADNLRAGIVLVRGESFAYIQAWSSTDVPRATLKQVWELPGFFLPPRDLDALRRGVMQVSERIRQFRAQ